MQTVQPAGWPRPRGYANGVVASGRLVFVAGQIGVEAGDGFVDQARRALSSIVEVLQAAGAEPTHLVRLTWYVTDKNAYRAWQHELGVVYREVIGSHYPAMTLVQVAGLLEDRAQVEIEATAVIP